MKQQNDEIGKWQNESTNVSTGSPNRHKVITESMKKKTTVLESEKSERNFE